MSNILDQAEKIVEANGFKDSTCQPRPLAFCDIFPTDGHDGFVLEAASFWWADECIWKHEVTSGGIARQSTPYSQDQTG